MPVPLILASKSKPCRDVLYSAGICPTIRVLHVGEPTTLEAAAREEDATIDDLSTKQRVMILATTKAEAVHRTYRGVADAIAAAAGSRVIAHPLKAKEIKDLERGAAVKDLREAAAGGPIDYSRAEITTTRDPSGTDMPTVTEPIATVIARQPGLTEATVGPLILGYDSMFLLGGECYGKPHSEAVACERLKRMSGAAGKLWTDHYLINFATGRTVYGASHTRVHLDEFTGADVKRYIAIDEPLEVAESFALEGFGGAFIDSIEGDPHGIIDLSLPLARYLADELGITWTDLWNVGRDKLEPESKASGNQHASVLPPVGDVHQPGDGWVDCTCDHKRWGTNGASSILLARCNPVSGGVTHVIIQHRAAWSAKGSTQGIPGGTTVDGESPIESALREGYEGINITPKDIEVVGSYREGHGPWAYTTVFAFKKPGHTIGPKVNDDEGMEIYWVPIDDVPNRKLFTAMETGRPRFAARLNGLTTTQQCTQHLNAMLTMTGIEQ